MEEEKPNRFGIFQKGQAPATIVGRYIPRRELFDLLNRKAASRVVCISAPAGYGKTSSTAMWLAEVGHVPVWIRLDAYDDNPVIFYRRLCAALANAYPGCVALRQVPENMAFGASPVEHTIDALLDVWQTWRASDARCALVLDDVHLLTHRGIASSLPYVIKRLPREATVLLLGRGGTVLDWTAAFFGMDVVRIGAEHLRFSPEEVRHCFTVAGRTISFTEAEEIARDTDGWPIAVAALADRASGVFDGTDDSRPGMLETPTKEAILTACIREQFWEPCDERTREFLLRTCIVDELTPELCERLSGDPDAERLMEEASARWMLTNAADGSYSHHTIFLDFLREQLEAAADRIDLAALYTIVADYYYSMKQYYRALYYALSAGDDEKIASSLHELLRYDNRNGSIAESVDRLSSRYLHAVSEKVLRKHPYLYVSFAWHAYLTGDAASMLRYLDGLYDMLPRIETEYPDFLESSILVCALDHRRPVTEAVRPFRRQALELVVQRDLQATSITQNFPFLHRSVRDLAAFALDPAAAEEYRTAFCDILGRDYRLIMAAVEAGLHYERGEPGAAYARAREAVDLYDSSSKVPELGFAARMILAAAADAMERQEEAAALRVALRHYLLNEEALYLMPNFEAYEAKLRLQKGEADAADVWLENYFVRLTDGADLGTFWEFSDAGFAEPVENGEKGRERLELFRIYQHFTTARAFMVRASVMAARSFLWRIVRLALDFDRPADEAEGLLLLAILEWHRGSRDEAVARLEEAVIRVQPFRYVRIFAEEGAALLPVLNALLGRSGADGKSEMVDRRLLREIRIAAYARAQTHIGIMGALRAKNIMLSPQQKLVLSYLARGYERAEIASEIGMTLNTVKTHIRLAYRKLDVNSAQEAVLKARQMELIE